MSIKPEGSVITFSGAGSATIYLGTIQFSFESEPFDRLEFDHDKLMQAKNTDGSVPVYLQRFGGGVVQLTTTCGITSSRPTSPNDADIDNIKRRFDIRRYTIKTLECTQTDTLAIATLAQAHKLLFDRFQFHLAKAQMDISFQLLTTMQADTFSYLTTTGLTMTGPSLNPYGSTIQNNCVIRSFTPETTYEIPQSDGSSQTFSDFGLVVDQMTEVPQSATTW